MSSRQNWRCSKFQLQSFARLFEGIEFRGPSSEHRLQILDLFGSFSSRGLAGERRTLNTVHVAPTHINRRYPHSPS
jgi:hypothetical protein